MLNTKKIKTSHLLLLIGFIMLLSGCSANSAEQTTIYAVDDKQSNAQHEQLTLELKKLQEENAKLTKLLVSGEMGSNLSEDDISDEYTSWFDEYPHLHRFTSSQEWDSIELSNAYGDITITDPDLLQYASWLFVIEPSNLDFPGGHYPHDIEPFYITLNNSLGSTQLDTYAQNYVSIEEVPYYLFEVSSEVAHLGRALLPRPTYMPIESLESRLLNSGGIMISRSDEYSYYDFSQSKQRSITTTFLESEKKLISEYQVQNSEYVIDIIYLLHGEQVFMRVYEDYICIVDIDDEIYWYETDGDVPAMIQGILSAG